MWRKHCAAGVSTCRRRSSTGCTTVSPGKPSLTVAGRSYPVDQASLLVRTPPGGLTGQPVRPSRPSGCAAGDYPSALPTGAIAVVDDSRCSVVDKQNSALAKGAVALIVISQPTAAGAPPTLFNPGYLQPADRAGRGCRRHRRRRAGRGHRAGTPGAGRRERQDHFTKRAGADQDRLAERRGDGRRASR